MSAAPDHGPQSEPVSVAYADRSGRVVTRQGPLSHWLEVDEIVTESNPALIGQEDSLAALIDSPEDEFTLTDISFSSQNQNTFHTITVRWDTAREQFEIRTSSIESGQHSSVDALRIQRKKDHGDQLLALERAHFRNIYEQSPQLAVCIGRDGSLVAASHLLRERFLKDKGSPESANLVAVLTGHRIWASLWEGTVPIGFPIRATDVDGRSCDLEVSAIAARHPNRLREEAYFTLIDITERNASRIALMERSDDLEVLSKRLQDSNKKLEQFASVAAHDLLAPLRRIAAFSDMLHEEIERNSSDSVKYALDAIRRSASTGQKLVEEILQLSRISSMDSRLETLELSELFNDVACEYDYSLSDAGGTVINTDKDIAVIGDARLVKLIFRNLLSNAIKYRHPDRALQIELKQSTNGTPHARIELIDNGVGMAADVAQKAFGPFVRLSEKGDIPGHGLGLAIVEEAAVAMNWHVFAHSEPNTGTRMVLTAPIA